MICSGEASILNPSGAPRDQEESNTARVRQFRPTYWVTTYWPEVIGGPLPLMRVLTTRLLGGDDVGTFTVGALPWVAVTVGSAPPPLETCVPEAEAAEASSLIMSTTTHSVSEPVTPPWELPLDPYPYLGGSTASTRLPIFLPSSAVCSPGRRVPDSTCGTVVYVLSASLCVLPSQMYTT